MLLRNSNTYAGWIQSRKKRYIILFSICVVLLLLIYPFQSVVVPEWRLKVIDTSGKPCPNMQVNEGWGHYSLALQPDTGGEFLFTNNNGYVTFPVRRTTASLLRRTIMPILTHMATILHGSTGIHAHVFASGMKNGVSLEYDPGKPLPDTITVERCYSNGA